MSLKPYKLGSLKDKIEIKEEALVKQMEEVEKNVEKKLQKRIKERIKGRSK